MFPVVDTPARLMLDLLLTSKERKTYAVFNLFFQGLRWITVASGWHWITCKAEEKLIYPSIHYLQHQGRGECWSLSQLVMGQKIAKRLSRPFRGGHTYKNHSWHCRVCQCILPVISFQISYVHCLIKVSLKHEGREDETFLTVKHFG